MDKDQIIGRMNALGINLGYNDCLQDYAYTAYLLVRERSDVSDDEVMYHCAKDWIIGLERIDQIDLITGIRNHIDKFKESVENKQHLTALR